MRGKLAILSLTICLMVLLANCATAPPAPEPRYEWVPVKLSARGSGAPPQSAVNPAQARLMAERAAKLDAMRNLLEETKGVRINSKTMVRDFITQSDTIRARVDGYLQGAKVIDTKYQSDGSVEVVIEILLGYEFRRIFP